MFDFILRLDFKYTYIHYGVYVYILIYTFFPSPFLFDIVVSYQAAAAAAKSLQSCPTLCDPVDCSPPGSSVHGIFRASS